MTGNIHTAAFYSWDSTAMRVTSPSASPQPAVFAGSQTSVEADVESSAEKVVDASTDDYVTGTRTSLILYTRQPTDARKVSSSPSWSIKSSVRSALYLRSMTMIFWNPYDQSGISTVAS